MQCISRITFYLCTQSLHAVLKTAAVRHIKLRPLFLYEAPPLIQHEIYLLLSCLQVMTLFNSSLAGVQTHRRWNFTITSAAIESLCCTVWELQYVLEAELHSKVGATNNSKNNSKFTMYTWMRLFVLDTSADSLFPFVACVQTAKSCGEGDNMSVHSGESVDTNINIYMLQH